MFKYLYYCDIAILIHNFEKFYSSKDFFDESNIWIAVFVPCKNVNNTTTFEKLSMY